jgi:hypothetical protein
VGPRVLRLLLAAEQDAERRVGEPAVDEAAARVPGALPPCLGGGVVLVRLLGLTATGLVAYGAFCFVDARLRDVSV